MATDSAEGVLRIALNRPDVSNAINAQMSRDLSEAFRQARRDETIRAVVITGIGSAFCAGHHLAGIEQTSNLADLLRENYNGLILAMRRLEKPVVASLNGVAADAGMSLALACDIRIASESAELHPAWVDAGLVPDAGSMYFLPRIVGLSKALELCLLGEPVTAEEALRIGLVSQVVMAEELPSATANLARRLASGAGKALGLTKRGLNRSLETGPDDMLEYEALLQQIAGRTADFREGVMAFKEKRPSTFTGA